MEPAPSKPNSENPSTGQWLDIDTAATLAKREAVTIRKWIQSGALRAFRHRRHHWVATEDLSRAALSMQKGLLPASLVAIGILPMECAGLDGFALTQWITDHECHDLYLPPPVTRHTPLTTGGRETPSVSEIWNEVVRMRAGLDALIAAVNPAPQRKPSFTDTDLLEFMQDVDRTLKLPCLSVPLVEKWSTKFLALSHSHMSALVGWATTQPKLAQELCGERLPVYAPLLKLAQRLRAFIRAIDPAVLGERRALLQVKVDQTWEHVEELCLTQTEMGIARGRSGEKYLPVGHSATDSYILQRM